MQHHYSRKLMKHGLVAMLVGLAAGFFLIFAMLGGASLSPVPVFIDFQLPGTESGWRVVHLGTLLNGIMAVAIACAMRTVYLTESKSRWVFLGTALAIWGNFCFYIFGMFAPNHGLTLEANRLGEASWAGAFAFAPALLGAITLIMALITVLRAESIDA